jgi:hypothetical protein
MQRTRDLRRYWAATRSSRRARHHSSIVHQDGALDCVCEGASFYFSKRRALGCNCRKRRRGQPRVGIGDKFDARRRIYQERRQRREILGAILLGRIEVEGDEVCF